MTQPTQFPQLALLERIIDALKTMPQIRAAFMRGSFYSGQPDAYSDLDIYIVADDVAGDRLVALGRQVLQAADRILWVSVLDSMPPRLRALVSGPLRVDLAIVTSATLPPYEGWRILLDRDNLLRDRARQVHAAEALQPEHVLKVCDEFWWNLFSSVSQLKRGQLWMALHLLDICRSDLAQIMRWRRDPEHPAERFLHLEQHLTAEDQQALAQTLAQYDLRGIAEALLCASDAFDPAAREVAARVDTPYPAALAQFTKEFFIRELWSLIAPGPTMSA